MPANVKLVKHLIKININFMPPIGRTWMLVFFIAKLSNCYQKLSGKVPVSRKCYHESAIFKFLRAFQILPIVYSIFTLDNLKQCNLSTTILYISRTWHRKSARKINILEECSVFKLKFCSSYSLYWQFFLKIARKAYCLTSLMNT